MEDQIQEIKSKIDIVEFISQYAEVKKSGRNFKALCPFHSEKSPSFVISPDRQIWHCFGSCGDGGDVIKFLMKMDNLSFIEALRELAEKTGVKLENISIEDSEVKKRDTILAMNNWAAQYYSHIFHNFPIAQKARDYVINRGINEKITNTFQFGYAPESWDSLIKFLKNKKYTYDELVLSGLVVSSSNGRIYDRFRNRLVFPIKDAKGNVIGFSARSLDPNEKAAKYINTPETPVYHKRESVFGINLVKEGIRKEDNVYIVEGEFDMIMPYQKGITNIVAIKGSALTKEQLHLLKRYTSKITLALDTDEAGIEAMKRGINEAEEFDFDIRVAQFTKGKDPDEAARNDYVVFKKELENAVPLYDFLFQVVKNKYPEDTSFAKKKIGDELVPYIKNIKNIIVRSHYIKHLAQILDMSEENVDKLIATTRKKTAFKSSILERTKKQIPREEMIQKYLLSFVFQHASPQKIANQVFSIVNPEDFTTPAYQKLVPLYLQHINSTAEGDTFDSFYKTLPAEMKAVADELYLYASGDDAFEKEKIWEIVYQLKEHSYRAFYSHYSQQTDAESEEKAIHYKGLLNKLNKKELENYFKSV